MPIKFHLTNLFLAPLYIQKAEETKCCDYEFEALHHLDIMLLSKVQRHYPFQLAIDFIFHNGMSLRNYRKAIPVSGKKQFEKVIASYSSKESLLVCSSWYVKRSMTRKIN